MLKYGGSKTVAALALVLTLLLANASARQTPPPGGVGREEEAAVRATAAAFAARLGATHDFATVARELYADDFMSHQLKRLTDWSERVQTSNVMLEGIPSLTFERGLAAKAEVEDWKRVRLAADSLLHFMVMSFLAEQEFGELGDPAKTNEQALVAVFPPEAVKALGTNPSASNFLRKREREVVVRTPEELRALADTLEEAVRLTRPHFAQTLAKGKHFETNMSLVARGFSDEKVTLAAAEAAGYPAGTRLFKVYAPNAYSLLLVRQGGVMKVVWAGWPSD
jgi:hypothetical protein